MMLTADVRMIPRDGAAMHGAAQVGAAADGRVVAKDTAAMHGAAEVGAPDFGAAVGRSGTCRKTSSS